MAVTKTARALQGSTSNSAGGTTTGSGFDLTTVLGMEALGIITNGATGPTIGCSFIIEISNDNTNWFEWYRGLAGTDANGVYYFPVNIPAEVMHARTKFTGNTGQAVTVQAVGHELTSI